ncbi:hypothetical protein Pmani_014113 [Petrolisthes manimaculis]|uniref:Uncharacterized protein n=1 Tax=Petrolisthes manimaculis TaxID=1843537 RepID=A0AAE1PX27_9EUCA|nr:hypothetical protein Pmani_014113 [Petrolisthes manimaculis]
MEHESGEGKLNEIGKANVGEKVIITHEKTDVRGVSDKAEVQVTDIELRGEIQSHVHPGNEIISKDEEKLNELSKKSSKKKRKRQVKKKPHHQHHHQQHQFLASSDNPGITLLHIHQNRENRIPKASVSIDRHRMPYMPLSLDHSPQDKKKAKEGKYTRSKDSHKPEEVSPSTSPSSSSSCSPTTNSTTSPLTRGVTHRNSKRLRSYFTAGGTSPSHNQSNSILHNTSNTLSSYNNNNINTITNISSTNNTTTNIPSIYNNNSNNTTSNKSINTSSYNYKNSTTSTSNNNTNNSNTPTYNVNNSSSYNNNSSSPSLPDSRNNTVSTSRHSWYHNNNNNDDNTNSISRNTNSNNKTNGVKEKKSGIPRLGCHAQSQHKPERHAGSFYSGNTADEVNEEHHYHSTSLLSVKAPDDQEWLENKQQQISSPNRRIRPPKNHYKSDERQGRNRRQPRGSKCSARNRDEMPVSNWNTAGYDSTHQPLGSTGSMKSSSCSSFVFNLPTSESSSEPHSPGDDIPLDVLTVCNPISQNDLNIRQGLIKHTSNFQVERYDGMLGNSVHDVTADIHSTECQHDDRCRLGEVGPGRDDFNDYRSQEYFFNHTNFTSQRDRQSEEEASKHYRYHKSRGSVEAGCEDTMTRFAAAHLPPPPPLPPPRPPTITLQTIQPQSNLALTSPLPPPSYVVKHQDNTVSPTPPPPSQVTKLYDNNVFPPPPPPPPSSQLTQPYGHFTSPSPPLPLPPPPPPPPAVVRASVEVPGRGPSFSHRSSPPPPPPPPTTTTTTTLPPPLTTTTPDANKIPDHDLASSDTEGKLYVGDYVAQQSNTDWRTNTTGEGTWTHLKVPEGYMIADTAHHLGLNIIDLRDSKTNLENFQNLPMSNFEIVILEECGGGGDGDEGSPSENWILRQGPLDKLDRISSRQPHPPPPPPPPKKKKRERNFGYGTLTKVKNSFENLLHSQTSRSGPVNKGAAQTQKNGTYKVTHRKERGRKKELEGSEKESGKNTKENGKKVNDNKLQGAEISRPLPPLIKMESGETSLYPVDTPGREAGIPFMSTRHLGTENPIHTWQSLINDTGLFWHQQQQQQQHEDSLTTKYPIVEMVPRDRMGRQERQDGDTHSHTIYTHPHVLLGQRPSPLTSTHHPRHRESCPEILPKSRHGSISRYGYDTELASISESPKESHYIMETPVQLRQRPTSHGVSHEGLNFHAHLLERECDGPRDSLFPLDAKPEGCCEEVPDSQPPQPQPPVKPRKGILKRTSNNSDTRPFSFPMEQQRQQQQPQHQQQQQQEKQQGKRKQVVTYHLPPTSEAPRQQQEEEEKEQEEEEDLGYECDTEHSMGEAESSSSGQELTPPRTHYHNNNNNNNNNKHLHPDSSITATTNTSNTSTTNATTSSTTTTTSTTSSNSASNTVGPL